MPKSDLLTTKLHRPSFPTKWVRRPQLVHRLNEGLQFNRVMTLVSAPAGFGKTACVGEWMDTLADAPPVAWLSLDPSDDDPVRFLSYLMAALHRIDRRLGHDIAEALRTGQLPPAEVVSAALVNDILEQGRRFVLALDDFHVIQDQFILQVLERLVIEMPQPLHLVLLTREDPPLPLARLRANNLLTEIRAEDLRFSLCDAQRFLRDVMGMSLSDADVAVLEHKTEGWIVGLQLAALSVRDRVDRSKFIASLTGSHRFILGYLTEEVLGRQPEAVQQFLLRTGILDMLNAELCDAVDGRSDGQEMLERLYSANLFLVTLDDEQQWYRYHHLFADLLRTRLRAEIEKPQLAELHRRASRWYAQAGMGGEAIQHALAAEDYATVVNLVDHHAMALVMQGYAKTVNGWVEALPKEWKSHSPRTNLALAWMYVLRGAYAEVTPHLERLEEAFANSSPGAAAGREDLSLRADWLVVRSLLHYMKGELGESMAASEQALETAPERDSRVRSLAWYARGSTLRAMGDGPRAVEAYDQAARYGKAAANPLAEIMSTVGLSQMALEQGQLRLALETASPVSARVERSGSASPFRALIHGILAEAHYHRCEIEPAEEEIRRALHLSTLGGYKTALIGCRVFLSRCFQLQGDVDAALREIRTAADLMGPEAADYLRQELDAQQISVHLARNHPKAARMILRARGFSFGDGLSSPELPRGKGISHSAGLLYNASLKFLLHQARAEGDSSLVRPGIELAGRAIDAALREQHLPVAIEGLLLRAQLHAAAGDGKARPDRSVEDYTRALEFGEPEGFVSLFVEQGLPVAEVLARLFRQNRLGTAGPVYVAGILAAASRLRRQAAGHDKRQAADPRQDQATPDLLKPLSEREIEVLYQMAEGLKYQEIAPRLFISVNTVRFHVKTIYGKLGVNNRTQAIHIARQLGLL